MEIQTIFLSYSRTDSAFVFKLATDLRNVEVTVWLDQKDIRSGTHFDTEIQKAIHLAKCIVVILSPKSVSSNNVLDEVAYALDEGKQIIPIMLVDCTVPLRLRRFQYIDFRKNYSAGLKHLLNELQPEASDILITKGTNHRNLLFITVIFFGLVVIALIVLFVPYLTKNDNKGSHTAVIKHNQGIISDSTANDSDKNDSIAIRKKSQSNEVASSEAARKKDESERKSENKNKKLRSVLIRKPIEADNSTPEIISWRIYDKNSKKSYTNGKDDGHIIVDSDGDLEISCTVHDPQGVKKVDIFGDVSWDCIKIGSRSSGGYQITGQLWDYTRNDNQVYTEVVTVLAVNLKNILKKACTDANSSLNFKTVNISIYCHAYNYQDAAKSNELKFQFLKNQ